MKKETEISHPGKVVEVSPEFISVEIITEGACSSCHAASLCGMSEYEKKAIQVPASGWTSYEVGEEVKVALTASMGHKAVWLAYAIPAMILVGVLMFVLSLGAGELVSALSAFFAVAIYYFVIYLLRGRLKNEYIFKIEKLKKQ